MLHPRKLSFTFSSATAAAKALWRAPFPCKVTAIYGYRVAGSGAVVKATKNSTDLLSANKSLTSATTWMAGSLSATAASLRLAAGDTLSAEVVSVAGSPTDVIVQIDVVRDADANA